MVSGSLLTSLKKWCARKLDTAPRAGKGYSFDAFEPATADIRKVKAPQFEGLLHFYAHGAPATTVRSTPGHVLCPQIPRHGRC
jgi:hypothetical protein